MPTHVIYRHAYQALLLVLSGDYALGSIQNRNHLHHLCRNERQFEEKRCRLGIHYNYTTCNNTVNLRMINHPWYTPVPAIFTSPGYVGFIPDALVWGGGVHPTPGGTAENGHGVLNASAVAREIFTPACPALRPFADKIVFLLPHARRSFKNSTDAPERVAAYVRLLPDLLFKHCRIRY
jgi:hypothetical protein